MLRTPFLLEALNQPLRIGLTNLDKIASQFFSTAPLNDGSCIPPGQITA
jgi:hypothetical protein